jgi:hypothetical protein
VTISYDNSVTKEVPIGEIQNYLSGAYFRHPNKTLLKNANKDKILVISGVLFAKNIIAEIETDFSLDISLILKLNEIVDGKLDFSITNEKKLKIISAGNSYFPIAVKAHRINFDKGHLNNTMLLTDHKKLF